MKTLGGKGRTCCPALTFADYSYFTQDLHKFKEEKKIIAAYAAHLRHFGADSIINY